MPCNASFAGIPVTSFCTREWPRAKPGTKFSWPQNTVTFPHPYPLGRAKLPFIEFPEQFIYIGRSDVRGGWVDSGVKAEEHDSKACIPSALGGVSMRVNESRASGSEGN
eukprot:scaffold324559_cov67-Tisochrysis_lutea.AAC.2